jgi:elongation factor P--beta-lysine ligase
MTLPIDLDNEILNYCNVNKIDYDKFLLKLVRRGFTNEKFGTVPIEKTVEVPVEKVTIKEIFVQDIDIEALKIENQTLKNEIEKLKLDIKRLTKKSDDKKSNQNSLNNFKIDKNDIYDEG